MPLSWEIQESDSPIIATAIHNGHEVRPELIPLLAIAEADRLREEDPHTGLWTAAADTRVIVHVSRFEIDLNRPRDKAVYRIPDDAWGHAVWREELPEERVRASLALYDEFYRTMEEVITRAIDHHGHAIVLDLHSYNHRRKGPDAEPDDPAGSPEINVGTGSVDRDRWGALIDTFIEGVRDYDFGGRHLDVRENVKFFGGNFPRWINGSFGERCCALAIECKKFFMDEWTADVDWDAFEHVRRACASAVPRLLALISEGSTP